MQGCLETKVSAVLSVSRGQQQPSSLCAQIAHVFHFSLCHHYYNTLAVFHAVSWKCTELMVNVFSKEVELRP